VASHSAIVSRQAKAFDQSQLFAEVARMKKVKLVMANFKKFAMPLKYHKNTLYDDGLPYLFDYIPGDIIFSNGVDPREIYEAGI
jgi:hypothetical protein